MLGLTMSARVMGNKAITTHYKNSAKRIKKEKRKRTRKALNYVRRELRKEIRGGTIRETGRGARGVKVKIHRRRGWGRSDDDYWGEVYYGASAFYIRILDTGTFRTPSKNIMARLFMDATFARTEKKAMEIYDGMLDGI